MVVAITHFEYKPDKLNELKSRWDGQLKVAMKQKGLYKGLLLTTPHGKGLSIGFWDSIDNAKGFGSSPDYQKFTQSLSEFIIGKPERHVYDVSGGDLSEILVAKKVA